MQYQRSLVYSIGFLCSISSTCFIQYTYYAVSEVPGLIQYTFYAVSAVPGLFNMPTMQYQRSLVYSVCLLCSISGPWLNQYAYYEV